jgi:hypothetical protein
MGVTYAPANVASEKQIKQSNPYSSKKTFLYAGLVAFLKKVFE